MSNIFPEPTELGRRIREFVKNSSPYKIQDLARVLGIHPGNISKRLGQNNIKVEELIKLAEHIEAPLFIRFGDVVVKNDFQAKAETLEQLKETTETQGSLIRYMQLAEERQEQILELKKELATYEKAAAAE